MIFIVSSLTFLNSDKYSTNADLINNKLKSADYWILTPIIIDDLNPTLSWYQKVWDHDWCTGNGSLEWPFLIENVTISGGELTNCITIRNSNDFFIIRNCTFYDSGSMLGNNAGIKLQNVENALIINNTVYNSSYGILLEDSNYNNLTENKINYNDNGVYLDTSFNNSITYNIIRYYEEAIVEVSCTDNTIENNQIIELPSENNGDNNGDNNGGITGNNFPIELVGVLIVILVISMVLTGMVLLRKKIFKKKYTHELKSEKRKEITQ
ncbi:MAG: NosD domain-containing protein, partial [Promethearchaeota archaeon]